MPISESQESARINAFFKMLTAFRLAESRTGVSATRSALAKVHKKSRFLRPVYKKVKTMTILVLQKNGSDVCPLRGILNMPAVKARVAGDQLSGHRKRPFGGAQPWYHTRTALQSPNARAGPRAARRAGSGERIPPPACVVAPLRGAVAGKGRLRYLPWLRTPDWALTMAYCSCARYAVFHGILMRLPRKFTCGLWGR